MRLATILLLSVLGIWSSCGGLAGFAGGTAAAQLRSGDMKAQAVRELRRQKGSFVAGKADAALTELVEKADTFRVFGVLAVVGGLLSLIAAFAVGLRSRRAPALGLVAVCVVAMAEAMLMVLVFFSGSGVVKLAVAGLTAILLMRGGETAGAPAEDPLAEP